MSFTPQMGSGSYSGGLSTAFAAGIQTSLIEEIKRPPELKCMHSTFVPEEYIEGRRSANSASLNRVYFTPKDLPVNLMKFFRTKYLSVEKAVWDFFPNTGQRTDKVRIEGRIPGFADGGIFGPAVIKVRNTGPFNLYLGEQVYLAPPYPCSSAYNTIQINENTYYIPMTVSSYYIKSLMTNTTLREDMSRGYVGNTMPPYMEYVLRGGFGEPTIENKYFQSLYNILPDPIINDADTRIPIVDPHLLDILRDKRTRVGHAKQKYGPNSLVSILHENKLENDLKYLSALVGGNNGQCKQVTNYAHTYPASLSSVQPAPIGVITLSYALHTNRSYGNTEQGVIKPGEEMNLTLFLN